MDIVKLLREEIKKSKQSRYRIAKETGVSQTRLCRLMQGESINAENAGRLLEHFGYTLTQQKGKSIRVFKKIHRTKGGEL